jgi:hypothetical protein
MIGNALTIALQEHRQLRGDTLFVGGVGAVLRVQALGLSSEVRNCLKAEPAKIY